MNSILITDSGVNATSGGGIVSLNLAEALQSCTSLKYIFSTQRFPDNKYKNIPAYTINPQHHGYTDTDPFFIDYLSFHLLPKDVPVNIVMSYGCPWGLTIEELKRVFHAKIVTDLAPHNIDVSREEHMKYVGKYPYPHLTNDMLWSLYSRHLRLSDVVIVHSHSSAEYIKEKARIKNDPKVIPHGCYLPETISPLPEQFTPSYFGAVGYDKGFTYLLSAWINHPLREKTKFLIGGTGSDFNLPQGMQYFEKIGFLENINNFYKRCSIGIFPSITEGFNICALEMMAAGRPIIIGKGAGISEIIENGKQGFVIDGRDIATIQNKIQWFFDNPNEVIRMGRESRLLAEKYEWSIIRKKYIEVYKELI